MKEKKKRKNVKLKEDVPGAILPREKPEECTVCYRKIQISVSKQKYIFSLDTSYLSYSIKCQTRRVPKVICAQRHTTNITKQSNKYTRT